MFMSDAIKYGKTCLFYLFKLKHHIYILIKHKTVWLAIGFYKRILLDHV